MGEINSIYSKASLIKKIILLTSSLFIFVVILEGGLRLGGVIFLTLQEQHNIHSGRENSYRIMCLGESTTALGGNDSYPSQLESILNQPNTGIRFNVVNKGVPGTDTTEIVDQLEESLDRYRPDLVVVMMGINDNSWNWSDVARPYKDRPNLFRSLRLYKLGRLIYLSLIYRDRGYGGYKVGGIIRKSSPGKIDNPSVDLEQKKKAAFEKEIAPDPLSYKAYMGLGWVYEKQSLHEEAERLFKKAIQIDGKNPTWYRSLGQTYFYRKEYALAEEAFKRAIELSPVNLGDASAYAELGECYLVTGRYSLAEEVFKDAVKCGLQLDRAYGGLASAYELQGRTELAGEYYKKAARYRLGYYNPSTLNNYQRMKKILDRRGIKLVCVQYPVRGIAPLRKIFTDCEGVIFVDNEKAFKEVLNKDNYKDYFYDMFGGDFGHCTRKGNMIRAVTHF